METYLVDVIGKIFSLYQLMLFIRILSSWFPEYQGHQLLRFINYYTDPYLDFFRSFIPPIAMIDFSPVIALFALQFIESVVKYFMLAIFF